MTTIVYDHKNKQIACDGRETAGDEIKSDDAIKHCFKDGVIYFIAGMPSDAECFLNEPKTNRHKPAIEINCTAIFVRDGKVFKGRFDDDTGYWEVELTYSDSIGTGGVYARAAIDFGCNAAESVHYASKRDVFTGGKVTVYDIESGKLL